LVSINPVGVGCGALMRQVPELCSGLSTVKPFGLRSAGKQKSGL
jgi:hypothetical protein